MGEGGGTEGARIPALGIANSEPEFSARTRASGRPRSPTRNPGAAGARAGRARGGGGGGGRPCGALGAARRREPRGGEARRPPAAPGHGPPGEPSCPRRAPSAPSLRGHDPARPLPASRAPSGPPGGLARVAGRSGCVGGAEGLRPNQTEGASARLVRADGCASFCLLFLGDLLRPSASTHPSTLLLGNYWDSQPWPSWSRGPELSWLRQLGTGE